ncbi:MAG TPA: hypothetical protein VFI13_05845, partial [Gemmatimonadales bacterium]|nr:hypothetical protein [Gemmatimonadales bacterium]
MRKPEFRWGSAPPAGRPWGPWALAIGLHSLLLFGWITGRPVDPVKFPVRFITLAPLESNGREVRIPVPNDVPERSRGVRSPRATLIAPPPEPPKPVPLADRPESTAAPAGPRLIGRLGPGLGEGRLWVQPLPLAPRELAAAVTHRDAKELADSFVTAVVQAYLDSIAHDPDVSTIRPPAWVATVGTTKFGIDASHIYIAGLKIPTAVLALLPIKGGNQRPIDHALESMAFDLRVAGARAANLSEFRQRVK